jgi:uncharacterized protein YegP (UPF0339 family)
LSLAFTAVGGAVGCAADVVAEDEEDATARAARFVVFKGIDDQWYFQAVAGNGEKVLRSEGYTSQAAAENGVESLRVNATDPSAYRQNKAVNGQYYFNIVAKNNEIIGTSETYLTKSNSERAAKTVQKIVRLANRQLAATNGGARFKVFTGADGQFYFNLTAGNGEIVLQSEGYTTKAAALKGVASVHENGLEASNFEIFESKNGQYFFDLYAKNNEIIAHGETYKTKYNAERAVETLSALIRTGKIADPK